ncbi:hypothetical protein OMAG_002063 [Candidatus Omnitrophus magneticus]|uniref:Uncharacterized protein n=1 Tax=Candidatus Omnitrophus magneticus TaxID=1609969 RepID=A0A0F0CPW7_9BACT|nr:hypothetical protein OMAG_002063 [Candidatus Omnitrophus magneticus]
MIIGTVIPAGSKFYEIKILTENRKSKLKIQAQKMGSGNDWMRGFKHYTEISLTA